MRIAAYEPDIPQNLGALMRLCSCLSVPLDIIGPCGFPFSTNNPTQERHLRRVAMDYASPKLIQGFSSWEAFLQVSEASESRLLLLTTSGEITYTDFCFNDGDTLLIGRETSGVPKHIHDLALARLVIPMAPPARSLNVVTAAAMVMGEALRQIKNNKARNVKLDLKQRRQLHDPTHSGSA